MTEPTKSQQPDWNKLLKSAQKGAVQVLNELCSHLDARLRTIVKYRLWGWSTQECEDIVQDTLMVFTQKLGEITSNPHFYAARILHNKIGNALQSHNTETTHRVADEVESTSVAKEIQSAQQTTDSHSKTDFERQVEYEELQDQIQSAIAHMGSFCQRFFMYILEGNDKKKMWEYFKNKESGLTRTTYDSRISRCRKRLRNSLSDVLPELSGDK